jgi:hypothetical protein
MNTTTAQSDVSSAQDASHSAPKKSKLKTFFIIVLPVFITLMVVWDWVATNSGDNQWQLVIDKEGTQIYAMDVAGSSTRKFKGVVHYSKYSMSNIIAPMVDEGIADDCSKWVPNCSDYQLIQGWDPQLKYNVQLWTINLFGPLLPREILLQGSIIQDPVSKVVTIENIAVPNKIAPNDCCVRLQQVHNVWTFTPLADGRIKVEFVQDLDMGGMFPDFLLNLGGADEMFKMLTVDNPAMLDKEQYKNAKLDFIEERS